MPSPFPGMDPYLESQGTWLDFHSRLISYSCDALEERLPDHYLALIGERIRLVDVPGEERTRFLPEILIAREDREGSAPPARPGVATIEPVILPLATKDREEVRETWIEIRKLPDRELITTIEVLSPTNKAGIGRDEYLDKRGRLIDQPVNLVEIDLLIGGHRVPMGHPLPRGHYHAILLRADRRPHGEVYSWTIRDSLPKIPIPLRAPDPDLPLDLAAIVATAYERGRYARIVDYATPLTLPLAAEGRAWAEERARTATGPTG